jgi:hypothetical protein
LPPAFGKFFFYIQLHPTCQLTACVKSQVFSSFPFCLKSDAKSTLFFCAKFRLFFLGFRFFQFSTSLLHHFCFFRCLVCLIRRLIISEKMRRPSLFFLCYFFVLRLVSVSLSPPEILSFVKFSVSCFSAVSLLFFLAISLQSAIIQTNRPTAE